MLKLLIPNKKTKSPRELQEEKDTLPFLTVYRGGVELCVEPGYFPSNF